MIVVGETQQERAKQAGMNNFTEAARVRAS